MNIITLTEDIERLLPIIYSGNPEIPKMAKCIRNYPLLTMDFGQEDITAIAEPFVTSGWGFEDDGPIFRTPFPQFRFHIRNRYATLYGICERSAEELRMLAVFVNSELWGNQGRAPSNCRVVVKTFLERGPKPGVLAWRTRCYDHDTGKEKANLDRQAYVVEYEDHQTPRRAPDYAKLPPQVKEALEFASNVAIVSLEATSAVYLKPSNHIAVVRPDKPGKSVEWMKAREHLTVIHRHHAANNPTVRAGSIVAQDETKHMQRIAHSRRAHTRVLKAARYTFARGRTIHIRATWVGPQEWKDTSGQIYRILEPV